MQPLQECEEAQAINQDWLDKLVLSYLQQERELQVCPPVQFRHTPCDSSVQSCHLVSPVVQADLPCAASLLRDCENVRQLVENGRILDGLSAGERVNSNPTKVSLRGRRPASRLHFGAAVQLPCLWPAGPEACVPAEEAATD